MDPPATISAPDPTDPMMVTSPCGNSMVWPERTEDDITRELGWGAEATGVPVSATSAEAETSPL
jgi:hypothetical protein